MSPFKGWKHLTIIQLKSSIGKRIRKHVSCHCWNLDNCKLFSEHSTIDTTNEEPKHDQLGTKGKELNKYTNNVTILGNTMFFITTNNFPLIYNDDTKQNESAMESKHLHTTDDIIKSQGTSSIFIYAQKRAFLFVNIVWLYQRWLEYQGSDFYMQRYRGQREKLNTWFGITILDESLL